MEEKISIYLKENALKLIIIFLLLFIIYKQSVIRDDIDSLDSRAYRIEETVEKIKDHFDI